MPHPNRPIRTRTQFLLAATALAATLAPMQGALAQVAASASASVHAHHGKTHALPKKKKTHNANAAVTPVAGAVAPAATIPAATARSYAPITPVADTHTTESIVVTGSALTTANNTSANPVQIVTAKDIQRTGVSTLGDFFQRLPSVGSSGTYNTQTNGTDGASCLDLRNLGQQRVLVLIDGKRTSLNGDSNCVDLNSLPIQQVSSIEILKDGGSELYGADAVSGVVNIKLRHDLNGANITVRGSITGHGDDKGGILSAYKGWNFDHDRGNLTLFGSYMTQGGVRQRNRSWANPVQTDNSATIFGSSYTSFGRFLDSKNSKYYSDDQNGNLGPRSRSRYQYGQSQSLLNQLQNSSLSGDTHYQINDHFNLYANVLYSHKTSSATMAPQPYSGTPNTVIIPQNYPGNTTGVPLQWLADRFTDFGPRRTNTAIDTTTAKFGVNGNIVQDWDYDLSYTYGTSQQMTETSGVGNYTNLLRQYGLIPSDLSNLTDTNSTFSYDPNACAGYTGCTPSSPFSKLSSAAAQYGNYTSHSHTAYMLRDLNLRINNNHVVHMPWSHGGDFGLAMGMEHRGEQLSYHPDAQVAAANTFGNSSLPTSGGFNVTEGYLEGQLPLLRNAFLAKDLTIDAQGRYSAYDTFGSAKNWKASIDWAPTRDIRFRGTIGTSFRQPNVVELYSGQALGYFSASDPCGQANAANYGAGAAIVAANCAKAGINTATFSAAGGSQVPGISGGNSHLTPETGRTYTFGTVITPRWVPGLSTSVTYWHYTITHLISTTGAQYVMDSCYTGTNTSQCSNIVRGAGDQITSVNQLYQNLGALQTSGIDWDTNYRLRVTHQDVFTVENNLQDLQGYKLQTVPGGQFYNMRGAMLYQGGSPVGNSQPVIRDYATFGWQHGPVGISYMVQYIDGVRWMDSAYNLVSKSSGLRYKTPPMIQQDLTLNYNYKDWGFEAGVQNIANKKPPFVASGTDNSNAAQYGNFYLGRYFFLQAGVNF